MDPLEVVDRFGASWSDHDLDAALSLVTDDCVFDATGPAPDGVRHTGRVAVRRACQAIFDDKDARFEAEDTFTAGDRVVQLLAVHLGEWARPRRGRVQGPGGAGDREALLREGVPHTHEVWRTP